jgi:hypothetical protein
MAYIFEMASGAEYLDEELRFPDESPASRTTPSPAYCPDRQVELRLATVAMETPRERVPNFSAAMDLGELIERLTDKD